MNISDDNKKIIVMLARDIKMQKNAIRFMERIAYKKYRCKPPPTKGLIFVACIGSEIVGSITLDIVNNNELFPVEKIHDCKHETAPLPFKRDKMVQFGRWMTTHPIVSQLLAYESARHALSIGKQIGVAEVKLKILSRLRQLGIECFEIPNTKLLFNQIPEEEKRYYEVETPPFLIMMHLAQITKTLKPLVNKYYSNL